MFVGLMFSSKVGGWVQLRPRVVGIVYVGHILIIKAEMLVCAKYL